MCNVACGFNVMPSFGVNDGGNPYIDSVRIPGNIVRTVQVRQLVALAEFRLAVQSRNVELRMAEWRLALTPGRR